jgi:hypothetical protein
MWACLRVDALIGKLQSLYWPPVDQVFLHNLRCILGPHVSVPYRLGVNDDCRAVLALIKATGLVDPHSVTQPSCFCGLLQLRMYFALPVGCTRWPRSALGTHIMANKNVVLERWQTLLLLH